jgi:DNA polymerase III delta prime subunit
MSQTSDLIWAERYRPATLDDCIIPASTKASLSEAVNNKNVINMLLYGPAGTGKTSACKAIANDLGADMLYINASLTRSIDVIRTDVVQFSSSASFTGAPKIVLLDECDGLTKDAQNSLKGVIEQFKNTRFFFTSNNVNDIIEPIRSRCSNINFRIGSDEKPKMASAFYRRVNKILQENSLEADKTVILELINRHFPDYRRILNELQAYSINGKIDIGILSVVHDEIFKPLINILREGNFPAMRNWVATNTHLTPREIFRKFYDECSEYFQNNYLPQLILTLSEYDYKASCSVDEEIVVAAALTDIMSGAVWK